MSQTVYPFDPTGLAETNLVKREVHMLTKVNEAPYRILIPTFAPFHLPDLLIEHVDLLGNRKELILNVEYNIALPYIEAQRTTGKLLYGGIPILTEHLEGRLEVTYRTVGGEWTADPNYVYQRLLEVVYNPRTCWWDKLTNVQNYFPPIDHAQDLNDFHQVDTLFEWMEKIRQAILQAPTNVPGAYVAHMLDRTQHPQDAGDLGITPVGKMALATDQEVMAHTTIDNEPKLMTFQQVMLLLRQQGILKP